MKYFLFTLIFALFVHTGWGQERTPPSKKQLASRKTNDGSLEAQLAREIINHFIQDSAEFPELFFLTENFPERLSIESFNKNRKSKITILSEKQRGVLLYFFEPFFIKRGTAIVTLNTEWSTHNGEGYYAKRIEYKCRLSKNRKWKCGVLSFSMTES